VYPNEVARTALLAGAVVLAVAAACSTQAQLVGSGGQCFAATDCQEGLFCLPQKSGTSICSNDLSQIQFTEDAAAGDTGTKPTGDGATGDDGATTGDDGATSPDSAMTLDSGTPDTSTMPDASTPDTSVLDTSVPDTSTPPDAGPDDAAAD
jgi:hypothetical protein